MNTPTTTHLKKLADLISDVDFSKSFDPNMVSPMLIMAEDVITQMKMDLHDIGDLDNLIPPMRGIFTRRAEMLPLMIVAAHAEIERLLGADACTVYLPEAA